MAAWIVHRELDAYFLAANNGVGALHPSGGGTLDGKVVTVDSPSPIPVNSWTHLALTYDGTALQLYVNGDSGSNNGGNGDN